MPVYLKKTFRSSLLTTDNVIFFLNSVISIGITMNFIKFVAMHKLYHIKDFIEWKAFGVCSAIGERMGVATSRIRLWFIYISFLTLGSPLIVYMVIAFWINIKQYILLRRRNPLKWL
jgi:phage shock protein PspC (stress-responsive transcriptional regulator)